MMLHATFTLGSKVRLGSQDYLLAELDRVNPEGPVFTLIGSDDPNLRVHYSCAALLAQYRHGNLRLVPSSENGKRLLLRNMADRRLIFDSMPGNRRYHRRDKKEAARDDSVAQAKRNARTALKIKVLQFVSNRRISLRYPKQFAEDIQEFRVDFPEYSVDKQASLPSLPTVVRWRRAQRVHLGDNSKLMDRTDLRGGTSYRVEAQTEEIMQRMIDEHYMAPMRLSMDTVHRMIEGYLLKRNQGLLPEHRHKIPGLSTVERRIKDRPAYDVHAARYGKAAADKTFRSSDRGYSNQIPFMAEFQIDHSWLDILVIDKHTNLVLGRPRLTLCVEPRTGMVMGFTIGFDGTSSIVLLECLRQAILPKDHEALKAMGVRSTWDAYGKPLIVNTDNGAEMHSECTISGCQELDIDLKWDGKRKPWFKASVERTVLEFVTRGTGYLSGAVVKPHMFKLLGLDKDPKNDPSKWAVLDLDQLNGLLHKWLIDEYLQSPNSGKGKISRAQLWSQLAKPEDIQLPADQREFDLLCTVPLTRTITHTGIAICDLKTFNSEALQKMRVRHGAQGVTVNIRYSPRKLDKLWFQEIGGDEWHEVFNRDPDTNDLSEHQIKVIHANQTLAAEQGRKITFAESRIETSKIALELVVAKTQAARRLGKRLLDPDSQRTKGNRSEKKFGETRVEPMPNTLVPSNVVPLVPPAHSATPIADPIVPPPRKEFAIPTFKRA